MAIRNDALDRYVFVKRTDLMDRPGGSPHVQCVDVWETLHRRKVRRTRLLVARIDIIVQ